MASSLGSSLIGSEFIDSNNPKAPRFIVNGRSTGPESMRIVTNGYDSRLSSKLASAVDRKIEEARQRDLGRYGELLRLSVDGKLSAKQTDELADVVIRLGLRPEQIDADQKDYIEHRQLSATNWKTEADLAQRDCFEATARLREIEQVELPKLRKESADKKARVSFCSASRQRLEVIAKSKPWLVPAPTEQSEK